MDNLNVELTEEGIVAELKKLAGDELDLPSELVDQIQADTQLIGGLRLDSLGQTVLLAAVEERYNFIFELEDRQRLQESKTVRDFARIVLRRAQGAVNDTTEAKVEDDS
jgi:acyl carrier protein